MTYLKPAFNFFIYSNLWIAAGAVALCLQTRYLITGKLIFSDFAIFAFFSTLLLYGVHRLVGLKKVKQQQARFAIIARFKPWLIGSSIVSAIVCGWLFLQFSFELKLAMVFPAMAAAGYAIPLFPKQKRLRDFSYVKIFLIALSWGMVTVILPAMEFHLFPNVPVAVIFLERCCFIFAIALPFDIRDLFIDKADGVITLPGKFGVNAAKNMAYTALALMLGFGWLNVELDAYTFANWLGLCSSGLLTAGLIYFAKEEKSDYYFTGLIDGMLLVQLPLMMLF